MVCLFIEYIRINLTSKEWSYALNKLIPIVAERMWNLNGIFNLLYVCLPIVCIFRRRTYDICIDIICFSKICRNFFTVVCSYWFAKFKVFWCKKWMVWSLRPFFSLQKIMLICIVCYIPLQCNVWSKKNYTCVKNSNRTCNKFRTIWLTYFFMKTKKSKKNFETDSTRR